IGQYKKTIRALTNFAAEHGGVYSPSLGAAFASMTVSPRTGRFSLDFSGSIMKPQVTKAP
ncbi:MAG TPA: hypothetical protein VED63_05500, partial [Acidimicrobiales bacterium]|nr:hypothetical protein [Acidimicrobiales bacterium]